MSFRLYSGTRSCNSSCSLFSVFLCIFLQEHAFESSQKYKEGKFIIELAHMIKDNGWEWRSGRALVFFWPWNALFIELRGASTTLPPSNLPSPPSPTPPLQKPSTKPPRRPSRAHTHRLIVKPNRTNDINSDDEELEQLLRNHIPGVLSLLQRLRVLLRGSGAFGFDPAPLTLTTPPPPPPPNHAYKWLWWYGDH